MTDQPPSYLQRDPAWEAAKRRLWALTAEERVTEMRAGRLSLRECAHWASQAPHEVPLLNGEYEYIARMTPEVAEAPAPASSDRKARRS